MLWTFPHCHCPPNLGRPVVVLSQSAILFKDQPDCRHRKISRMIDCSDVFAINCLLRTRPRSANSWALKALGLIKVEPSAKVYRQSYPKGTLPVSSQRLNLC